MKTIKHEFQRSNTSNAMHFAQEMHYIGKDIVRSLIRRKCFNNSLGLALTINSPNVWPYIVACWLKIRINGLGSYLSNSDTLI